MYISFGQEAFDDYNAWEEEDKKLYEKIMQVQK
jgi:Txe/YoeB family toxin of Txe-Axe toxin-antitoxin module